MSPLASLLRGLRLGRQLDVGRMATALGTTRRRLELAEAGAVFPPASERRAWGRRLGYPTLAAFDALWRDGWMQQLHDAQRAGWIPVINKAPAGEPVDYAEFGVDSRWGYEYVPRPSHLDRAEVLFAVVVIGDSMWPAYGEGDLVIFQPVDATDRDVDGLPGRAALPDESAVFVRFNAGSPVAARAGACTFKMLRRRFDGRIELRPENPAHATFIAAADEIDRLALAVERRPAFWRPPAGVRHVHDEYAQEFPDDA